MTTFLMINKSDSSIGQNIQNSALIQKFYKDSEGEEIYKGNQGFAYISKHTVTISAHIF